MATGVGKIRGVGTFDSACGELKVGTTELLRQSQFRSAKVRRRKGPALSSFACLGMIQLEFGRTGLP